jgi:aminoglycoside phosphotransferase (APT) family kinase protein
MTDYPESPRPLISKGRTAEILQFGEGRVLKLFFDRYPERYAVTEAQIGRLVYQSGAPVPRIYDLVTINGRHGIVYQHVIGETMLVHLKRQPWRLTALARLMAELHAALHQIVLPELNAQPARLSEQLAAAPGLTNFTCSHLLEKLERMQSGVQALCHGDFHPDNVILTATGPVIIDWLTATSGDPAADVARSRLLLEISQPVHDQSLRDRLLVAAIRRLFVSRYLKHYCKLTGLSESRLKAWEPIVAAARLSEGIMPEEAVLRTKIAAPSSVS